MLLLAFFGLLPDFFILNCILSTFFTALLNSVLRTASCCSLNKSCIGNNSIMRPQWLFEDVTLSLFCPGDVCGQQLVECVNVDVTAAGCSHPVSSGCHYQPSTPSYPLFLCFCKLLLRATLILILQTHLTVFMDLSY